MLYNFSEALTGTRLTTSYTRVGGLARDLPSGFLEEVGRWLDRFSRELDEYETLLTKNKIWVERTQGVGILTTKLAIDLGVSGPNLRAYGANGTCARRAPTRATSNTTSTSPSARRATSTTATSCASRECGNR